jgi:tape measure domain-containing protein
MAAPTDVKQLLLQVDASVELLRRNLNAGQARVDQFAGDTQRRLDGIDRRFGEVGRPLTNLNTSIAATKRQISSIGTSVVQTEASVRRSAEGMRTALLGSAAGIASALSADRLKDYADGYTRFTNSLATAGIEGQRLAKTQEGVYAIAQRNGVQLEALGSLYGNIASLQKDLNASDADTLKVSGAVAAALKIKGASAEQAAGAILGLTQALGNGKFQAEEFNQINDGARPLLQAAADASDKYRGSLGKLRQDVLAGTVTSKALFEMIVAGAGALETKAAKANLTIGNSFTVLNNALGKYIGETDASLSATARIAGGIETLSNNLDTIIPALTLIAVTFGTVKAAGLAVGGVSAVLATVMETDRALAQQIVLGNATYVSRAQLAARSAELAAAGAATEVASIESTIAARRAEQIALTEQIAAERALVAERQAAARAAAVSLTQGGLNGRNAALAAQAKANNDATFATQRLTAARQRLAVVDGELAVAEGSLAGAQARSTAATNLAAAATTRATLAARAGAVASRLFAGALTLIGGSVAGGAAVLAIGALVGAIILFRNAAAAAEERNKATAASMEETAAASRRLNQGLAILASTGSAAASGIAQTGSSASTATGKMLTFAGAVGEAAAKLRQLAEARRREQVLSFATDSVAAEKRANEAQARINARRPSDSAVARLGSLAISNADRQANAADARIVAENRALQQANYQAAERASRIPLANRIRESDRNGGRDIEGELARVTRDLTIARERGHRSQIDTLQAQKFELTQYKKYRKDGLSPEAAQQAATADAGQFRDASTGAQGERDAKTGAAAQRKAEREAAAAERKAKAEVRDAAADERAYSAAERQANNDIAAARADLTNSAVERAKIEKDRIETERQNRNNEIAQQAKQGGLGDGKVAETRKLELQRLNDERAKLETDVVDARERQREADEALNIASANRSNEVELLQRQSDLVTTASERRDLEQRILNIQYQEERAKLEGVIASRDTTEAEKKIAQQRLALLGQLQAADQRSVDRNNAGPLDQYRERLRRTVGDTNEALQGVAVDGLESLEDGLAGIVSGTESVGSAFKKMATSIIADLARIAIRKAIVSAIGGSFFGLASGGKIEGRATGGKISGPGTGTSDSILALIDGKDPLMVSNGESIVTAAATAKYWPIIDAMNKGRVPGLATGGMVGSPKLPSVVAPSLPSLSGLGGRAQRIAVDLNATIDAAPEFEVKMQNVAASTVGAAAEPIMAGAQTRTIRRLQRPSLPGGLG